MSNVIGLNGHIPSKVGQPQEALIRIIEALLEKAQSGELQSFIGTGFVSDGGRLTAWFDHGENVYEMMGSLAFLQHEFARRHADAG